MHGGIARPERADIAAARREPPSRVVPPPEADL
jgi:hypothetical protein